MNVIYEYKKEWTFIGYHTAISPAEGDRKCPEFWEKEYAVKYARLWQTMKPENPVEAAILENGIGMYAICTDGEYWIAGEYRGGEVPDGLELFVFAESGWACFSARGPIPGSLRSLNAWVWKEWMPTEGKKHGADASAIVEVYSACDPRSPEYECGILVPVKAIP